MRRWLWKVGEVLVVSGLVVFILVPWGLEAEFVKRLYASSPVLTASLIVLLAVLVMAMTVHGIQERRKNKRKQEERHGTVPRHALTDSK
jgi:hypothetical protein